MSVPANPKVSSDVIATAYHEAGHAVIAQSLGIKVFHACVVPRYGDGGHSMDSVPSMNP